MTTVVPQIALENPAWAHQRAYVQRNAKFRLPMVQPEEALGCSVLICGSGPTLAQTFDPTHRHMHPTQVWGCNAALRWLWEHGKRVTHGFAVAGEEGLLDDWKPFPPVQYIVSSGVWPVVVERLRARHRKVRFYHTILGPRLGVPDERAFYAKLFPPSLCVPPSGGFNVTNIAVAIALGMGFGAIYVCGADCCLHLGPDPRPDAEDRTRSDAEFEQAHAAWKAQQVMYVDGRDAVTAFGKDVLLPSGTIAGRTFVSRPDMLLSAVHLVELAARFPARVQLVGDTLPNWLRSLPDDQWRPFMPKIVGTTVGNFAPLDRSPERT